MTVAFVKRLWRATRRLRHIAMEMVVALSLAFLVWLYTHSRARDTLDQVSIPVQLQLASTHLEQYELEVHGPTRIVASFTGPAARIRALRRQVQRGQVHVQLCVPVPEEHQNDSYRETRRVDAGDIPVPPGVVAVLPEQGNAISYTVYRVVERHVPVRLEVVGDGRISQVKLEPATVRVRGRRDIVERLGALPTQAYNLGGPNDEGKDTLVQGQASLVSEWDRRPLQTSPRSVTFSCKVRPRLKTYEIADIPVQFLCPAGFPWRPRFALANGGKITVNVRGPAAEEPPPVTAYVDLTAGDVGQGRNLLPVRLQLPRDYQLVGEATPLVAFFLEAEATDP